MGKLGSIWGLGGILFLISCAIFRLFPHALSVFNHQLSPLQIIILIVFSFFMVFCEGYKGFQKKFSPRTAARIKYLHDNPKLLHVILAPLFCMGYFFSNKKTKVISISLTLGIIILVILVKLLPSPWRGIIDFGVILGLSYGIISLLIFTIYAFLNKLDYSPETPE